MTQPANLESLICSSRASFRLLTDEERQASLEAFLAPWRPHTDIWVFGYGSLVWRPEFDYLEQRQAHVNGYHRSLCLWSRRNRGTPEQPGLVFGLDAGGSCRGMAYRIASRRVRDTLYELWKREMPSGAYIPKWLNCRTRQGNIRALVFTMDRSTDAYVPGLTKEQLISIVQNAHGIYGPCTEYVLETANALKQVGIQDSKLETLVSGLQDKSAPSREGELATQRAPKG